MSLPGIALGYTGFMAKVMVSFPDEVLARIDREAQRRGTSRSGLLRDAALRELGRADPAVIDAAVARSRSRFASAGRFDTTALIRAERDALDRRHL
ncbi:MAG: CopG family transcriptional regulator [Candidatus Dormibacteraceae bacterium]